MSKDMQEHMDAVRSIIESRCHSVSADHAGRLSGGDDVDPEDDTQLFGDAPVVVDAPLRNVGASRDVPTESNNPKDIAARSKCPLQLIPPTAEREVAHVLADGNSKYGPWNWRDKGIGLMTYVGAIQRHANAIRDGQDIDPESGRPHTAHIAATAMILIDAADHGKLIDDRPIDG